MSRRSKSGIVNVRMVITEEKILSNIDKVQKLINPKSKKQIVQFEDDTYFKDLIESIKAYLIEYPKKKNFPVSVYKAAYELVEFATNQFEENTKKVEELIRQREENIALAGQLKDLIEAVENKTDDWKDRISEAEEEGKFSEDVIDTLKLVGKDKTRKSQNYQDAIKLLNARVNNLESNLHIEIDMERIEDRSKALSYIGIEVAEALKVIPKPVDLGTAVSEAEKVQEEVKIEEISEAQEAEKIEEKKVEKVVEAPKEKVAVFFKTYFKVIKECDTMDDCFAPAYLSLNSGKKLEGTYDKNMKSYVLASGAAIRPYYTGQSNKIINLGLDTNGPKGPNIVGRDFFFLYVYNNGLIDDTIGSDTSLNAPLSTEHREKMFTNMCLNDSDSGCFGKILNDNWQMNY